VQALRLGEAQREERAGEGAAMAGVLEERDRGAAAATFAALNRHRPWVTEGKKYTGLTLEERKVAAEARDRMVQRSFSGHNPPPGVTVYPH
jgi:hypothetical protein